ncbi:hypothetical protein MYSTI_02549 [Myxococcus stipitatus DSM 14675]|uniref:DUF1579 domain-containing protein n=1 Tax=Myxococcus stipitatus (strain DSM 14675 / JCM 12634 / Mx s8) TaxID=1278073 RepID=L7U7S0_MYXSD|nr:hypothetical protein [Myxococcus stipitatus]AGC43865.1 hypothetical protein MYSTI_02549 [Myxococcus stipitatus DSM 14675]
MRRAVASCWVVLSLLSPWSARAAEPVESAGARAFKRLGALVGTWEGTFSNGKVHHVTYRLSAVNSVLVETWALGPERESLTLYHLDGDTLVADHYCPQGNTPRLELAKRADGDSLSFVFRDGTNLKVKGKSHQHAFWVRLDGPDAFARGETYVENGSTPPQLAKAGPGEAVTYRRVATP